MKPPSHTRDRSPEPTLFRSASIDRAAVDATARTVELSFSSETPVERYFGLEILSHEPGHVRLSRLESAAPLLLNHDRSAQIGVVEKVWIDAATRKGRALVRFGKSALADEIFQDVQDGIRRLVSVGYRIHRQESEKRPDGVESVRATDWEPYEISIVSIPADNSVGVGRQTEPANNNFSPAAMSNQANTAQPSPVNPPAPETRQAEPPAAAPVQVTREAPRDEIAQERKRIAAISGIGDQMRTQGVTLDVSRAIAEGTSVDAFRAAALDQLVQSRQNFQPKWTPGESKDIARFDLGRALRSMTAGRQLDGIEAEIAAEGEKEAREAGISNSGALMLPRAFVRAGMTATGTTSTAGDQGGMTVATAKGALLDDFFNASVLRDLGATVLEGLVGNLDMPRLIAGTDPAGKAENAEADAATATTAQLQLRPKRLPAYIDISDQLLNQSSSAIEALLRRHLQNQLLAIQERAFFHGSGSNEAAGIAGTSGIGAVVGGATGAAPTWAHIVSLEEKVDAQNGAMGSLAYVSNGQIRAKLKQTPKQGSGVEGNFILSDLAPNTINGYRAAFTNAVRRNLEKSTSGAVLSAIFFGNFADYVIGYWGGLALEVVRDAAGAKKGERSLVANVYYDGGVLRPKSFSAMVDAAGA